MAKETDQVFRKGIVRARTKLSDIESTLNVPTEVDHGDIGEALIEARGTAANLRQQLFEIDAMLMNVNDGQPDPSAPLQQTLDEATVS